MDRRQLLLGMSALALAKSSLGSLSLNAQSISSRSASAADILNPTLSDREKDGLRGPVKSVLNENSSTEYDAAGHTLYWHFKADDGSEYGDDYLYESAGRLLKISRKNYDHSSSEELYSYDESGRLLLIVTAHGSSTKFEYEDGTLRRKIRTLLPTPLRQSIAEAGFSDSSVFDRLESERGLPDGRTVITIFDPQGRPTEMQVHHGDGSIYMRGTRTYDSHGRVKGEKAVTENVAPLFLASFSDTERAEIASQPDGLEQISKAFGELFKKLGPHRASYVYDSEGRLVQTRHDGMTMRVLVNKTYNDHGDIIEERQSYTENSEIPVGVDFSLDQNGNFAPDKPPSEWASQPQLPPPMVMHYSYIYDSYGNWTDRTSTFPGGTNHHTQHRTLTYF